MKVVVNRTFGGFSISRECAELMAKWGSERAARELAKAEKDNYWYGYGYIDGWNDKGYDRTDPLLVRAVEELGAHSSKNGLLAVVEIPDGVKWYIHNYDGMETIHEEHRSW